MKCPYRTKIREYQYRGTKTQETLFLDCIKYDCPFYKPITFNGSSNEWHYGCGKAEKECS